MIDATAYSSHFGMIHASPARHWGRTARTMMTVHSTNAANINPCQSLPSSTNSQPWLPSRRQAPPSLPSGPAQTPTSVPHTSATSTMNSTSTSPR